MTILRLACSKQAYLPALIAVAATSPVQAASNAASTLMDTIGVTLIFVAIGLIFFLPSIIAFFRRHPNRWVLLLLNTFLGGTGLGWFGALIWAFHAVHRSPTGNHGGESGLNITVNDWDRFEPAPSPAPSPLRSPTPPSSTAPADRLRQLAALHAEGVIDQAEYHRLRTSVLRELSERG